MNMGNKYIYILFHTKYDPQKWQKSKIFDKYKYNTINRLVGRKQVLIVNAGENMPHSGLFKQYTFPTERLVLK